MESLKSENEKLKQDMEGLKADLKSREIFCIKNSLEIKFTYLVRIPSRYVSDIFA
jgi:hypothetical protein